MHLIVCQMMKDVTLLHKELQFKTARSGGSGGQHVNKVETKVYLHFNIIDSSILDENEKHLLLSKLSNFITKEGILVMSHERKRSQFSNKKAVLKKFDTLVVKALAKKKKRIPTKPSAAAMARIRNEKKRKSELKSLRRKPTIND